MLHKETFKSTVMRTSRNLQSFYRLEYDEDRYQDQEHPIGES